MTHQVQRTWKDGWGSDPTEPVTVPADVTLILMYFVNYLDRVNIGFAGPNGVFGDGDSRWIPGWLDRLRRAAYSASDIGTATPLSNDATILSYPKVDGGNPVPGLMGSHSSAFAPVSDIRDSICTSLPRVPGCPCRIVA